MIKKSENVTASQFWGAFWDPFWDPKWYQNPQFFDAEKRYDFEYHFGKVFRQILVISGVIPCAAHVPPAAGEKEKSK